MIYRIAIEKKKSFDNSGCKEIMTYIHIAASVDKLKTKQSHKKMERPENPIRE